MLNLQSGRGAKEGCLVQTAKTVKEECLRTECLTRAKGAWPFKIFKYIYAYCIQRKKFKNLKIQKKKKKEVNIRV